jgi:hypothetical protein
MSSSASCVYAAPATRYLIVQGNHVTVGLPMACNDPPRNGYKPSVFYLRITSANLTRVLASISSLLSLAQSTGDPAADFARRPAFTGWCVRAVLAGAGGGAPSRPRPDHSSRALGSEYDVWRHGPICRDAPFGSGTLAVNQALPLGFFGSSAVGCIPGCGKWRRVRWPSSSRSLTGLPGMWC